MTNLKNFRLNLSRCTTGRDVAPLTVGANPGRWEGWARKSSANLKKTKTYILDIPDSSRLDGLLGDSVFLPE